MDPLLVPEFTAIYTKISFKDPKPASVLLHRRYYVTPCYSRTDPKHRFEVRELTQWRDRDKQDYLICKVFTKDQAISYIETSCRVDDNFRGAYE